MKKRVMKTLLSSLLVALVLVGGTLAYLKASDSPLINTFKLAKVSTEIFEETGVNKAPQVKNTGESPVYVRAKAVITDLPEGVTVDMSKAYNTPDWQYNAEDEFYYYRKILLPAANSETPSLTSKLFTITNVQIKNEPGFTPTAGMNFSVDVYQEAVLAPANGDWSMKAAKEAFDKKG